jgi:menaquinone-9 beta-reductase
MWDVLIAGAGPAGTVTATILARAGVRVLLVDRARFPRDKLCGDSINPGAIAVLRRHNLAEPVERHGLPIQEMVIYGGQRVRVAARYPHHLRGWTMLRRDLDQWLLAGAIRAGARFEEGVTVRGALMKPHGASERVAGLVIDSRGGKQVPIRARLTIAADGRRSTLAFGLRLSAHPAHPRRWAVGAHFDRVEDAALCGEMHIQSRQYIGVAPLPNGLTNVCAVGTAASLPHLNNPERALREAIARDPTMRDRFGNARLAARPVILGPLAVDTRAAGVPGLLLAGDAAGFIDPITGDGLRFAFRGAELAAEAALEMLNTGNSEMHVALAHRRRVAFRGKWCFNRTLRRLIDSPSALRAATFGASIVPAYVRSLVAVAGDCGALYGSSSDGTILDDLCHIDRRAPSRPHA